MHPKFRSLIGWLAYPALVLLTHPILWRGTRLVHLALIKAMGIRAKYPARGGTIMVHEEKFLRRALALFSGTFVVFDVGAHVGDYSRAARRMAPRARVVAFEPNPLLLGQLRARIPDVEVFPFALSDQSGAAQLHDFADEPGSSCGSLHAEKIPFHGGVAQTYPVQTRTLDDFCAEQGIGHVHLLKIDTEGHDLRVLRGARRLLEAKAIDVIQFEIIAVNAVLRVFLRDFAAQLPGYRLYRLALSGRLLPLGEYDPLEWEIFAEQNIIAVRDSVAIMG